MGLFLTALLLILVIPIFISGCQKVLDEIDDSIPVSPPAIELGDVRDTTTDINKGKDDLINEEVLNLQKKLDGFDEAMGELENFDGDAAASEIDRELDSF